MSARVVGLDLSLTATGIADATGQTWTVKPRNKGDRRLLDIVSDVLGAAAGVELAVIEDLPNHARAAGLTGLVHGAVRLALMRCEVRYATVPPATLKKFAAGRGNAGKPEMAVAAFKRLGVELADDNQTDALWLRAAGLQLLGEPVVQLPAAQVAALDKVVLP